jgi:hypothetical protein
VRVAQHRLVAAEAENDMNKLMLTMRHVQGILDPRAFATLKKSFATALAR